VHIPAAPRPLRVTSLDPAVRGRGHPAPVATPEERMGAVMVLVVGVSLCVVPQNDRNGIMTYGVGRPPCTPTARTVCMSPELSRTTTATMVLVRMHSGVTAAMVRRVHSYAIELAQHHSLHNILLAVSFDATTGDMSKLNHLRNLLKHDQLESNVVIHTFTEQAVLDAYPKIREAAAGMYAPNRHKPILWGFHVEPILLFWNAMPTQLRQRVRWMWMLEADVVWTGRIKQFVDVCVTISSHCSDVCPWSSAVACV
jgi:hypothetical protein